MRFRFRAMRRRRRAKRVMRSTIRKKKEPTAMPTLPPVESLRDLVTSACGEAVLAGDCEATTDDSIEEEIDGVDCPETNADLVSGVDMLEEFAD